MIKFIQQFLRFGIVGVLNTLVDLGIFNIISLIVFSNTPTTTEFIISKSFSFLCAVILSFYLNKYFVFKSNTRNKILVFIIISCISLVINSFIGAMMFEYLSHSNLSDLFVKNISAVAGSIAAMIVNFIGYKYIVFKK